MQLEQLPLPAFPRKKGRPRIHASRQALARLTMQGTRQRKRAAGLRPVTVWLPVATIEAAGIVAQDKQVTRDVVLTELINKALIPNQESPTVTHPLTY